MKLTLKLFALTLISAGTGVTAHAQFSEDALRFSTSGLGVGARAIGMGGAYTGIASDYSALFWNPAGLAQLEHGEFSIGLSHLNYQNTSGYLGASQNYSNNATALNALGLALPVPVRRGSLVFAFGYNRQSTYTTGVAFEAFNPNSSIIQTYNRDGASVGGRPSGVAWELYLADTTRNSQGQLVYDSPIINRVTQIGKAIEGGGLNNWSIGAGIDIAPNISVGASLNYATGSYKYDRSYKERDSRNIYSSPTVSPMQFDQFTLDDFVESDLSGFNARLGLLYRVPDRFRIGLNVQTPTVLRVKESFGTTYKAFFDNGDVIAPDPDRLSGEYDVASPWVLSAGASVMIRDLVLSGDAQFTDWTQMEFRNANPDVLALNRTIKDIFRSTINLRGGAEYDIRTAGVRIRGGFIYNPSPFIGDPSDFDQKYVTAGLGFLLSNDTMIDLSYARGWWKTFRTVYSGSPRVTEDVKTNTFNLTFSYRY